MKSSPNAAALLDEMLSYHEPASLNLAWHRIRAKTIPLGERPNINQVPAVKRTSTEDVIASEHSSLSGSEQRRAHVQRRELSESERDVIETLETTGGVVSATTLARELGCSAKSLRRCELHRLVVAGEIVAVPGRGYRRAGR